MFKQPSITEEAIRACLVERAEALSASRGLSFSAIGIAAVGDSKFISRVRSGLGFNVKTYQRALSWIERASAQEAAE